METHLGGESSYEKAKHYEKTIYVEVGNISHLK